MNYEARGANAEVMKQEQWSPTDAQCAYPRPPIAENKAQFKAQPKTLLYALSIYNTNVEV